MSARVALFVTCLADQVAPEVGAAAVELLEAAGCRVEFPPAQTCCGQPAASDGAPEAASRLARHFIEVFDEPIPVVTPSGSCAAMVHHWYPRLVPDRAAEAQAVAARTFELGEYLVEQRGVTEVDAHLEATVAVHDACHGRRTLGLGAAPRALLAAAGARLVELTDPEECCGFGGTFAQQHPEVSVPLADRKLADAAATGADYLAGGDAACLLHLAGRRRRTGRGPEPVHWAVLLAGARRGERPPGAR